MTNHAAPFAADDMHVSTMLACERRMATGVLDSRSPPAALAERSRDSIAMDGRRWERVGWVERRVSGRLEWI